MSDILICRQQTDPQQILARCPPKNVTVSTNDSLILFILIVVLLIILEGTLECSKNRICVRVAGACRFRNWGPHSLLMYYVSVVLVVGGNNMHGL